MSQAVASTAAMRSLIDGMAAATDQELIAIAEHICSNGWKLLDAVTPNPVIELFSSKGPEINTQLGNLRDAIAAVHDSTAQGRQAIIAATSYLQATIMTTDAFYGGDSGWDSALETFSADIARLLNDALAHIVVPILAPWLRPLWHKTRWYVIGIAVILAAVLVIRKGLK